LNCRQLSDACQIVGLLRRSNRRPHGRHEAAAKN